MIGLRREEGKALGDEVADSEGVSPITQGSFPTLFPALGQKWFCPGSEAETLGNSAAEVDCPIARLSQACFGLLTR